MLFVFDFIEHLLSDAGLLAEMLDWTPAVKLLVTSREVLNLRGEWVFDVQGLPVPGPEGRCESASSSAVTLFVQRAPAAFKL